MLELVYFTLAAYGLTQILNMEQSSTRCDQANNGLEDLVNYFIVQCVWAFGLEFFCGE